MIRSSAQPFKLRVLGSAGAALLVWLLPAQARASGHLPMFDDGTAIALGAAAAVIPNESGVLVVRRVPNFVLGWSWQIPFTKSFEHRVIGSIDWVPASDEHRIRGRLGYRFATRYFFAGLGNALDRSGVTWSPEIGAKFAHFTRAEKQIDISLHLVVRADIAPAFNEFRALSVLAGWNLI